MYQIDDIGSTFISLPPNMQTTDNECLGYAFDKQIKKLLKLAKKLTVWSDLDHADPKYYDYMAMTIRAPYYRSDYPDKQKLALIKSAILTRRYAGTTKAIEELLSHTFTDATFVPWYEYNGEPYHFKITMESEPTEEMKALFAAMLKRVKAARSIIDGVEINDGGIKTTIYIGLGLQPTGEISIANMEEIDRKLHGTWYAATAAIIQQELKINKEE
ncbi:MAG: phage tail protein [Lachnospiraceae bacterium]